MKNFYKKSLEVIKRKNLFRERKIFDDKLIDLASNDYLGFAEDKNVLEETYQILKNEKYHSPRASMLVNGYSSIHKEFEQQLIKLNGFENALIFGSGFLANCGIIEALVRNGDFLILDEFYHASGIIATKLLDKNSVVYFSHNSPEDLNKKITEIKKSRDFTSKSRIIIAVEGIYSMEGTTLNPKIFEIADDNQAILIVDEAHSFGILGDSLLGVYEYFKIKIKSNHIKLGTLGKAMGSYGAYILASNEIVSFLENRAKTVIYSTAPSLFDILYASKSLEKMVKNRDRFKLKITKNRDLFNQKLNSTQKGLIFIHQMDSSEGVLKAKEKFEEKGFLIGGIRPPTVVKPILRIIPRISVTEQKFTQFFKILDNFR